MFVGVSAEVVVSDTEISVVFLPMIRPPHAIFAGYGRGLKATVVFAFACHFFFGEDSLLCARCFVAILPFLTDVRGVAPAFHVRDPAVVVDL